MWLVLSKTFALIFLVHLLGGVSSQALQPRKGLGSFLPDGRIINGTLASVNATKHQVSLRRRLNDGYYFGTGHICGGSLIAPNVVLCAAHCFVDQELNDGTLLPAEDFIVVMGNLDRFVINNFTLVLDIDRIAYALTTEKFNKSTYEQDIALLFLSDSVPANHPTIKPIEINWAPMANGTVCQVTGWGLTEDGVLTDFLMTVDVPIIASQECAEESDFEDDVIRAGMMCAGYMDEGERDACGGDSGGPLVCHGRQAGIVSWGMGCALPKLPGVYTDVAYYAPWIYDQLRAVNITLPGNATAPGGSNSTAPGGNNSTVPGGTSSNVPAGGILLLLNLFALSFILNKLL